MRLKDLCEIKTNFPDADFWVIRKGSKEAVGKPNYWFHYMHSKKIFEQLAHGTLRLVNLKLEDIKNLPVGTRD